MMCVLGVEGVPRLTSVNQRTILFSHIHFMGALGGATQAMRLSWKELLRHPKGPEI